MQEIRKKGGGCAAVRQYILDRVRACACTTDPYVRITGAEIAGAVGIKPQSANEHVRHLIRQGVIVRRRRCYFREPPDAPCEVVDLQRRKQGAGYEAVRDAVLEQIENRSCKADLFVRINGEELGARVDLPPAAARRHLRELVRRGVICRDGDSCYYAAVAEVQREQLRAWIRIRMGRDIFVDDPLLLIDPVEAATALGISKLEIGGLFRQLSMLDMAFHVCRVLDFDEESE
jgi:DNA-binding MarR family transcriptional regulator